MLKLSGDSVIFSDNTSLSSANETNPVDYTLILNNDNSISAYDLTSIGDYQFSGNTGIGLRIGNSVTSIGSYAFYYSGFTGNLTLPNSVTSIGDGAFRGCADFSGNLVIPNSVTSIGDSAFNSCYGLSGNLNIPNSVTSIKNGAFYYCSGLTNVNCYAPLSVFPNSNEFSGCTFSTFHVQSSDNSWTAGSTTLGGHTFTVIKDLT